MRIVYLSILTIIGVILSVLVCKKEKILLKKAIIIVCIVAVYFTIGIVINLNTISPNVEKAIQEIKEQYGDSEVKVKGSSIYVNINNKWVNVEEIVIVGDFARDSTVKYDSKEIYLNSPGIRNTIEVLKNLGIVK